MYLERVGGWEEFLKMGGIGHFLKNSKIQKIA